MVIEHFKKKIKKKKKKKKKLDEKEVDESSDYPIHEKYVKEEPYKEA